MTATRYCNKIRVHQNPQQNQNEIFKNTRALSSTKRNSEHFCFKLHATEVTETAENQHECRSGAHYSPV